MDFKIVIGWILGVFSQLIVDDRNAIVLTRQQFLKVKDFFDKNFKARGGLKNRHLGGSYDQNLLKEFKSILDQLESVYSGVFIKIPALTLMLQKSLELISEYQEDPTLFSNREVAVLCDLKVLWTFSENALSPLDLIKQCLYGGMFKRLMNWLYFYLGSVMAKIY